MTNSKKMGFIAALFIGILTISACAKATPTVDPVIKITEVAATVMAQITQQAALTPSATPTLAATATATQMPPTPTLAPEEITPSPTATSAVVADSTADKAVYVADVTYPDGSIVKPNTAFVKTWAIRNTGTTTWKTAYRLAYLEGLQDKPGLLYVHLPNDVKPQEVVNISVTFTSPNEMATFYSYWRLVNADGQPFGEQMSMKIVVGNP